MLASKLLTLAASVASASAQAYQGFNYGSVFTDNSPITQTDYENEFNTAKQLVGTSGFASARIYTMIQAGTSNAPTEAIPAAIATKTSLLLGLFLSADQSAFNNELAALRSALATYGQSFADLIAGISVGSEDLYRISPTGIENHSNPGLGPAEVANYILQVRNLIVGTAASGKPVGHVDTWTAWVNGSNAAVINAVDFLGMDAYPYFQNTMSNAIESGNTLFFDAYHATVGAAGGKPVWVTETGWPVSGPTENLAVASTTNAKVYWDQVGCSLFGRTNTWWYTLQDAYPTTPSPSFGVVGTTLSTTPLYDLSCSSSSSLLNSATSQTATSASAKVASTASTISTISTASTASTSAKLESSSNSPTASTGEESQSAPERQTSVEASTSVIATNPVPTGSETKTTMASSSEVVPTSAVASTLSTITKVSSTTQQGSSPTQSQPAGTCSTDLSGSYQFPHLIVEVDKNQPTMALGNSYNAHISSTVSSLFNFDIPPSYEGKTCSLIFLFPERARLLTAHYTVSGHGGIDVGRLQSPVVEQTTYNTVPATAKDVGTLANLLAGNSYIVASGACFAGQRVGYEVSATGTLDLEYFQNSNEPPIGLYITAC